jgi:hypothetical protein
MHNLDSCQDRAMFDLSVSPLRPFRAPPAIETLRPLPPALPSTILRPLPTLAFASMPCLPIPLSTGPCSLRDQQSQGLTDNAMGIDCPESQGPESLHSQLPLSAAHKNSIAWGLSANLSTGFTRQCPTHLHKPIMRYQRQQAVPEHGVPAFQEKGDSRGFNRTPESSGQFFYISTLFQCALNADTTRLWFSLCTPYFLEPSGSFQPDAFGAQPHLQLLPTAADCGNGIKQRQRTHGAVKLDAPVEATGLGVPTNSRKWKWPRPSRGLVKSDVSSYRRTPQPPSQLEVNHKIECDDARKQRVAYSMTPWQTLLMDFYPALPTSNAQPLKVEPAWGRAMFRRAIFAAVFESRRRRMERGDVQYSGGLIPHPTVAAPKPPPVSSSSRAPPDTHQVLQENPSPLHEESRTAARPAPSSLSLPTISTPSLGVKPFVSSESQVAGSLGWCTSCSSQIEFEDNQDNRPTTDVPIEPGKHTCKRAVCQVLQNSDSTLSGCFLSSPMSKPSCPASPATPPTPRRRRRPRKKPLPTQSAYGERILLSSVVRRRRAGVPAKASSDTSISTSTAETLPLVYPSQQPKHEVNCGHVNYSQTRRGSDTLASIFDGDLSDLEEDRAPLSGSVPDSACSRLPEAVSSIRLNTMWRTVAPVKVPQRHRERLVVALKGLKKGACGTVNTMNSNAARNAVLARAKKVEQGGISGVMSNSNGKVRSHEGQKIADAEIRRMVELLTFIRSPPEKGAKVKP